MEKDIEEAIDGLRAAVETERPDVFRSILSTLQEVEITHDLDIVQRILSEQVCDDGTLLHLATKKKQPDIVRILLTAGANPGIVNGRGETSLTSLSEGDPLLEVYGQELLQATAQSNVDRMRELLEAGIDIHSLDHPSHRNTPLHWAASYGDRAIVKCLCEHGADVNATNALGRTPLHDAVERGDTDVAEELLCQGADIHASFINKDGREVCVVDLAEGHTMMLEMLHNPPVPYSYSSNKNPDPDSTTPLTLMPNGPLVSPMPNGHIPSLILQKKSFALKSPNFQHGLRERQATLLWPQPQVVIKKPGDYLSVPDTLDVYLVPGPTCSTRQALAMWQLRSKHFTRLGAHIEPSVFCSQSDRAIPHVMCHVNPRLCQGPDTYRITVLHNQIKLLCDNISGLSHAISTLIQLFTVYKDETTIDIPQIQIEDWPEFKIRGVLLVVSQGRIPTVETLKNSIDILSLLKVNHIQLYSKFRCEHWPLPYSQSDLLDLGQFCSDRCIELVPALEVGVNIQYEDLGSLYTIFSDYLNCFPNTQYVNIGPRLSSFLLSPTDGSISHTDIHRLLPLSQNHTLMFCGYPLHDVSQSILQRIDPSFLFMQYGIQADHEYTQFASRLSHSGLAFCCCPGTSAWNSISGCPEAAVSSCVAAVKCASDHGGLGVMVCDWSSARGHVTPDCASWSGYLLTAGLGWNSDIPSESLKEYLPDLLSLHIYNDLSTTFGTIVSEMGIAETALLRAAHAYRSEEWQGIPDDRGSTLFQLLIEPDNVVLDQLSPDVFQKVTRHIKRCQTELENCVLKCPQSDYIIAELGLTMDLMLFAIKIGRALTVMGRNPSNAMGLNVINPGIANLQATTKTDLANKLLGLLSTYRGVWAKRYLPHGLTDSLLSLQAPLKQLIPEEEQAITTQENE